MSGVDGNWSVVNRVIHYSRPGARLFKVWYGSSGQEIWWKAYRRMLPRCQKPPNQNVLSDLCNFNDGLWMDAAASPASLERPLLMVV